VLLPLDERERNISSGHRLLLSPSSMSFFAIPVSSSPWTARVLRSGGEGREKKTQMRWIWWRLGHRPCPSPHGQGWPGAALPRRRCSITYGVASPFATRVRAGKRRTNGNMKRRICPLRGSRTTSGTTAAPWPSQPHGTPRTLSRRQPGPGKSRPTDQRLSGYIRKGDGALKEPTARTT
jgi:hypothetical protein